MALKRNIVLGLAAAGIAASPVIATAAPALDGARALSSVSGESELSGANNSWLIGLAAVLIGVAAIIVAGDDDDDTPTSP